MARNYDVLVVGGGLAGLTAAMFGARYGLKTGLIERMNGGAQIINVENIENFPGFPQGISGAELAPSIQVQATDAGAEMILAEATSISRDGTYKLVSTDAGGCRAKTVIVATGSTLRQLGIPGEAEFWGRGVSHCATCDGHLYNRDIVGVIGGGDSAADEAITLSAFAERVLLFHRGEQLRAHKILQDRLHENRKIEVVWNSEVEEVLGEESVTGIRLRNVVTNLENVVELSGLFIYVGLEPNTELVRGLVKVDNSGHIPVNLSMETEVPGLYAAGDIRQSSASQLISSAGDGATAAVAAFGYIKSKNW